VVDKRRRQSSPQGNAVVSQIIRELVVCTVISGRISGTHARRRGACAARNKAATARIVAVGYGELTVM
jgi:hypothetical protein